MPTKAELERQITEMLKREEKLSALESVAVLTPGDKLCEACYRNESGTVLITPKRPVYLCGDCLSALDCFLADFNIRII